MLFPKLDAKEQVKHGLRWAAKDLTETLKRDLENYHLYEGRTPHSLDMAYMKNKNLAYMKNKNTAAIYSRRLKVLLPKVFDW